MRRIVRFERLKDAASALSSSKVFSGIVASDVIARPGTTSRVQFAGLPPELSSWVAGLVFSEVGAGSALDRFVSAPESSSIDFIMPPMATVYGAAWALMFRRRIARGTAMVSKVNGGEIGIEKLGIPGSCRNVCRGELDAPLMPSVSFAGNREALC